jgi:hypothetical protein
VSAGRRSSAHSDSATRAATRSSTAARRSSMASSRWRRRRFGRTRSATTRMRISGRTTSPRRPSRPAPI